MLNLPKLESAIIGRCALLSLALVPMTALCVSPDVQTIIQKSVEANERDFKAAPYFNYREEDRDGPNSKTYQVYMIDGSPYQRLIAINGKPLSESQSVQEEKKLEQEKARRQAESSSDRKNRIAKYEKDRHRDHELMQQLTKAFDFKFVGTRKMESRDVYLLKATPKPGYNPPNMETQVLLGMEGQLWIDAETYQWVKVTAKVIRPVSIEGFLAQVQPGTRFELEKMPVGNGIWQPKHFSMKSHSKVLFLFNRRSQADETYSDYQRIEGSNTKSVQQGSGK
ncbi:MAG TPA: hypothetical protein VN737_08320 [Bryobacteraceae bacterium]|nr:hypothetical protein [Bryobacteraceae bacterium]